MGADENAVQRAVVFAVAVVGTLLNGAFDALICLAVHNCFLLFVDSKLVCPYFRKPYRKTIPILAFVLRACYDKINIKKGE